MRLEWETLRTMDNRFAWMSLVCAALVVFEHTFAQPMQGTFSWWVNKTCFNQGIPEVAVPYFFFASGYFLSKHINDHDWWYTAVTRRLKTLIVPFLCWNCCWVLFLFAGKLIADRLGITLHSVGDIPQGPTLILRCFGLDLLHNPMLAVLWYVRALFVFVLLSGVISKVIANKGRGLAFCAVLYIVMVLVVPRLVTEDGSVGYVFTRLVPLTGLFFFCSGTYVRRFDFAPWRKVNWFVLLFVVSALIGKAWLVSIGLGGCALILSVAILPLVMLALLSFMPKCNISRASVAGFAFPLYVMHPFGLCLVNGLIGPAVHQSVILSFGVSTCVILMSYGMMIVVRRFAWLSSLLYGGR